MQTLTNTVDEAYYNETVGHYIHSLNSYYTTFDTSNDGRADTTLVYNTKTGGFTQYLYPNISCYGKHTTADGEVWDLFSSAS